MSKQILISYSWREYESLWVTVDDDLDEDDEEAVIEALETSLGTRFGEDDEVGADVLETIPEEPEA